MALKLAQPDSVFFVIVVICFSLFSFLFFFFFDFQNLGEIIHPYLCFLK